MKKKILFFSISASILLIVDYLNFYICNSYTCREVSDAILLNTLILIGLTLVFSLSLAYFSSRLFIAWWNFARIAIPIILVLSTLINLQLHHTPSGGVLNMDDMFDLPALFVMYGVFVLGSIIQIWRGYKKDNLK